jgi:hypothetical protein
MWESQRLRKRRGKEIRKRGDNDTPSDGNAGSWLETCDPHPRVFFVRVANKGLMLDAASTSAKRGAREGGSTVED